jgi:hypothetical protein
MGTQTGLSATAVRDVLAALATGNLPDVHWLVGDDLCDCTFQRIGEWTNPYLARTLRVRMCCIWERLYEQFPEYVQRLDASYDENRHRYVTEPAAWDSPDMAMPVAIWHRQLAKEQGKSLAEIRQEYAGRERERPGPNPNAVRDVPTEDEMRFALEARLRAAGWVTEDETMLWGA